MFNFFPLDWCSVSKDYNVLERLNSDSQLQSANKLPGGQLIRKLKDRGAVLPLQYFSYPDTRKLIVKNIACIYWAKFQAVCGLQR